jgi:hypothetical protein
MSIARHELRAAEPDPKRSGGESADAPWLARALELSSSVQTWMPRRGLRKLAGSADWRPGVSVVVSQMEWPTSRVDHAVQSIVRAARQITEPFELILVPASGQPEIAPPGARFRVQRLRAVAGGGFVQGVKRALAAARYDWIYLLDPSIEIEAETIKEALRYRAPQVFAIGSRIEGNGATGWNDARLTGDVIVPYAAKPEESGLARGNLYADGRAALYRRAALGAVLDPGERYLAPRWNDLEWGIRAWRAGYEVLFCPNSRVRQVNSGAAQSPNARRRDQIQFDLRNAWTSLQPGKLTRMATQGDAKTHAGLWQFGNACQVFLSRLKASAAPVRDLPWSHLRTKYYPNPWRPGDTRPTILVAAPYALFPPTHGGAHRIHRLLDRVARHYRVILLSDEPQAYAEESAPYLAYLGAVHFAGGRRESPSAEPERIARMKSHSHDSLANELSRLVAVYHPRLVQIEYMELALLARRRQGRTPWLLTLHDCLLTGAVEPTREDRFERDWIGRFDHLIVCGEEDAALLPGLPVSVVPNGAATHHGDYTPSAGSRDILFLGPFRYRPNWDGIREFLREAYPALLVRVPGVQLRVLGGVDAEKRAEGCELFRQPGVTVHDHVDDVEPWLRTCALSVNPIRDNRGTCLKVIQSLAAGRVCVSTREGARGFLSSGLESLIAVERVSQLAEPIARLLEDEAARVKIEVPEAEKLAAFSWERAAETQMAVYERLLGERESRDDSRLSRLDSLRHGLRDTIQQLPESAG